jgi:hypothetical protein
MVTLMTKKEEDAERDKVLLRMLKTPPKAHKDEKHPRPAKPKPSRTKQDRKTSREIHN